ncbi:MAG TPA: aminoacyl-tRNA hydrolase [Candidatus Dormibacteraeota bacterium]|nr:aminoacyl-tRNA hydrolase [Candidatus Dormibacteraeota bacterium]
MTKLVVGLGNPGAEYAATRHNVGFMVIDEVAQRHGVTRWKKKDGAQQANDAARSVVLIKPVTFMNLSGTPARLISSWYRTTPSGVLVVSDDMDLPFGKLRMRPSGGHGGHNGLRSIIATIGEDFPRIRVGLGRPEYDGVDHVLGPFRGDERDALPSIVAAAADGVERWIDEGLEAAMRFVNAWSPTDTRSERD